MTASNNAHGRLSLGSFIKLSVIAAIGCLPVAVLFLAFLHLNVITSAGIVVGSGFFAGLCGYPFYAWQCRRREGIVLKGEFEVLTPNIVHGKLSLGSFIKISVTAAIGCLPVLAVLAVLAFLVGLASGHNSFGLFLLFYLWWAFLGVFIMEAVIAAVIAVGSGFFAGLCGYPFYAWLCRRPGGIVLKGKFEVL